MKFPVIQWKIIFWTTIFAIAMGFLETSVVVYMRALLYPGGFSFPLAAIPQSLALTEILREAATLVMLIGIGYLIGKNGITRFAYFLYAFAVWDIFYYVFLKLLIHWPESWFTWDILFLIPITWVGPVIAPIIVSLTMILLAFVILYFNSEVESVNLNRIEWIFLIVGSILLIVSFTLDYSAYILEHYRFADIWSVPNESMLKLAMKYIPRQFNWPLFLMAELIIVVGIGLFFNRIIKINKSQLTK